MRRLLAVVFLGLLIVAAPKAPAQELTIDRVAPPESFMVARLHDWSRFRDLVDQTALGDLWDREEVREWLEPVWDDLESRFAPEQDDLAEEDFPEPAGHIGVAWWIGGDGASHSFIMLDYQDEAPRAYDMALDDAEREEEQDNATLEFSDYGDHEIATITRRAGAQGTDDQRPEGDGEQGPPQTSHLALIDGAVLMSTDLVRLKDALDVADGDEVDTVERNDNLAAARRALGEVEADLVFLSGGEAPVAAILGESSMLPPAILESLALDRVRALAVGAAVDTADAIVEVRAAALLPADEGLFRLLLPDEGLSAPAFASPDAASLGVLRVDLPGVVPALQEVIRSLPEDARREADAFLTPVVLTVGPILRNMGDRVVTVARYERPYAPDSERSVTAVEVTNEQLLAGALNQYAQGWGVQMREFGDSQIWDAPAQAGVDLSVGLGRGWLFVGDGASVESALRQAGADDAPSLAGEPRFTAATRPLARSAVSFGWADLREWLEFMQWSYDNLEAMVRAQFAAMPGFEPDQEMIDEMVGYAESQFPYMFMEGMPPARDLTRDLGDIAFEITRAEDGLRMRVLLTRPVR